MLSLLYVDDLIICGLMEAINDVKRFEIGFYL